MSEKWTRELVYMAAGLQEPAGWAQRNGILLDNGEVARTGKTTQMLASAVAASLDGSEVCLIGISHRHDERLVADARAMQSRCVGVFEAMGLPLKPGRIRPAPGRPSGNRAKLFVDHATPMVGDRARRLREAGRMASGVKDGH